VKLFYCLVRKGSTLLDVGACGLPRVYPGRPVRDAIPITTGRPQHEYDTRHATRGNPPTHPCQPPENVSDDNSKRSGESYEQRGDQHAVSSCEEVPPSAEAVRSDETAETADQSAGASDSAETDTEDDDMAEKVTIHVTIDEYQRRFLRHTHDGQEVNVSELTRATLDALIPASKRPDDAPDRDFDVSLAYNGPLANLPETNGTSQPQE